MLKDEILEYPYVGTIERLGDDGKPLEIYNGVMDETMMTDDEGRLLQTSSYIVSIPLTKDMNYDYIIPTKGDTITLKRYGQTIKFTVDNAEPSQIGGVSIYATRKSWR